MIWKDDHGDNGYHAHCTGQQNSYKYVDGDDGYQAQGWHFPPLLLAGQCLVGAVAPGDNVDYL